jgi:hypothetical protein
VNSVKIGSTITVNPTSDVVANFSSVINVSGNVTLEIRNTGANQVKIDDISWTGFSASIPSLAVSGTTAHGSTCVNSAATTKTYTITFWITESNGSA